MHYVPNFCNPAGGREIFVRGLIQHLQNYDIQQSVISISNDGQTKVIKFDNIAVFLLAGNKLGAYRIMKGLSRLLQKSKCDIINIHGYGEYAGDIACILKIIRRLDVPLVLTTHGIAGLKNGYLALDYSLPFSHRERILRLLHLIYDFTLGRLEMKTFDNIIVLSEEEKTYLSKIGLKKNNTTKISIAVNDIFLNYSSDSGRINRILYVGRIDRYKGIDILLKSLKELMSCDIKLKCIIIGKDYGYRSDLEVLIENLELSSLVEIRDVVSQEDLLGLYSSAIMTVLPSFTEGFPLTLLESMALGTPFIATPVGAIPELVKLSNAGLLVPIGDPVCLAHKIRSLIENRKLWSELSNNGKSYAKNFTWNKITKLYFDLYSEVIH